MADIKLKPGTETVLTFATTAPVSGRRMASQEVEIVADDVTAHEDQVQVTIEADGGTAGEAINVFVAQGDSGSAFDGPVTPSTDPSLATLNNIDPGGALIADGVNLVRSSHVFRVLQSRFVVVIENATNNALSNLVVTVREFNYESN